MPGDDVRVMLELRDQDLVAFVEVVSPPAGRDEVDRLRCPTREDDLLRPRGAKESRHVRARALIRLGRLLGEGMDTTMHIGVRLLVEVHERVDDNAWLLCRGSVIEVGQR